MRLIDLPLTLDKYSLCESPICDAPATAGGCAIEGAGERANVIDLESIPELAVIDRSP
jgi:hypothetical protein